MRTTILMRHGEANEAERDFDRPLSSRGERQCHASCKSLAEANLEPGRIICSSAARTVRSAQLLAQGCSFGGRVEVQRSLYLASADQYLGAIRETEDHVQCVLLVAHNPGLSTLASLLRQTYVGLGTGEYVAICWPQTRWQDFGV